MQTIETRRRCKPRVVTGDLRPSDMLVAFFATGIVFLLAGAAAAVLDTVAGLDRGRWLAVHLALAGGVSLLVLGAAQFFAGAFLATGPPPRALVRAQLAFWTGGTIAVAAGLVADLDALTGAGAVALLTALVLFAAGLDRLRRGSLQRAPWAVRWYLTAVAFLVLGGLAGMSLATGTPRPSGDVLSAHLALNVAGWLGCAIVGTLHTFYPSLTQTRLSFPRLQSWTYGAWVAGVAAMAAGYGFEVAPLAVAGWAGLLAGASLLAVNVAAAARAAWPLRLPAQLVGAAQLWLIAGLCVGLAGVASSPGAVLIGAERSAAAVLLVGGWVGMTVLGSLLHLLAVMGHVRSLPRKSEPRAGALDRWLAPVALLGVAVLAAARLGGLDVLATAGAVLLLCFYVPAGAKVVRLAFTAVRAAPLRI